MYDDDHAPSSTAEDQPLDLATAYAELQTLVLDSPDVVDFLNGTCALASSVVPGTHCSITLRQGSRTMSVAGNDALALALDEEQYARGRGPCLEAMRSAVRVDVPDMATEQRWGDYGRYAAAHGVGSALSLPLDVDGKTVGAVNLFAALPHAFSEADAARATAFARQSGAALTIMMRQVRSRDLDQQLRAALATRAVIDQALGILMYTRRVGAGEAFELLREMSQTSNRKVSDLAAAVVESMTGHPPEPPRPLTRRE
jgi:GAF domain-containing protein